MTAFLLAHTSVRTMSMLMSVDNVYLKFNIVFSIYRIKKKSTPEQRYDKVYNICDSTDAIYRDGMRYLNENNIMGFTFYNC